MTNLAASPSPPLEDRITFLVHRINAHLMRVTNPKLKDWKVDLTESRLLVALLEKGPRTAGDIVRIMALPQSTISHQVKRLETLGYLSRTTGEADSRVVMVALTDAGREVALQANEHSRGIALRLLDAIGPDDVERVRAAMKRVDSILSS